MYQQNISRGNQRRRRRIEPQEEKDEIAGMPPGRMVLVLAIVVGCFGILWPRIFSPLLFGERPAPESTDEDSKFGVGLLDRTANS